MYLSTTLFIIYGLPSLFLIISFIFLLSSSSKFKYSFYRVVQLDLLINVFCYSNTWIAIRLMMDPAGKDILVWLYKNINFLYRLSHFLVVWFFHAQSVSTLLICTHRLTTALFERSNDFWRRYTPLVYLGAFVYCSGVLSRWWLFGDNYVQYKLVNETLIPVYDQTSASALASITLAFSVIYFVMISLTGAATVIVISRRFGSQASSLTKKMTRIALVHTAIYTGLLAYLLLNQISSLYAVKLVPNEVQWMLQLCASDTITLSMPYILMICDRNVRDFALLQKTSQFSKTTQVQSTTKTVQIE
ncbi:unnamed protein product [Caenorhabditis auriculariae]|uniref:Serpentine receptor class gamma n=1 Tax=Caenorhabditis auriculariae TaxID=2777116 RepID=A0A8S1GTX0_9PELO|nr:unnamed protein product [Caenorhabditis auriculariae]